MEFTGKKVMVVGMAASGISAANLLNKIGAEVILYDAKPKENFDLSQIKGAFTDRFEADPCEVVKEADILVMSPGVPVKLPFVDLAKKLHKPVIAEIELGFLTAKADFVCISGTNGKTTTTALTGEIFKNAGKRTYVLGNIGVPICEHSLETKKGDIIVAETAALQLETIDTFRPRAAALLNVTEDHLNRFGTMEYYTACKMRMFENMTSDDFAIINKDDEIASKQAKNINGPHFLWFSRKEEVEGAFVKDGRILFRYGDRQEDICAVEDIFIPGAHNLENALAAVALAMVMGIEPEVIAHTLKTFKGVEHRIEFVKTVNGVSFINDSKGTNPDATIKAIEAMKAPTVLILGGYDKKSEFDDLFRAFTKDIKHIVILGETKEKIKAAAEKAGFQNYVLAQTFKDAVLKAYELAPKGGNVLLSPACASWDMFQCFEQRGEEFKSIVNSLG